MEVQKISPKPQVEGLTLNEGILYSLRCMREWIREENRYF